MTQTKPNRPKVEMVKLDEVHAADWNPRIISEFQMRALQESLQTFGAVEPIVIDQGGMILGGHQRAAAARAIGWDSMPAIRIEVDADQAKRLNLALNKISGDWNERQLAEVLASVLADPSDPVEILEAGFTEFDVKAALEHLTDPLGPDGFPEPDDVTNTECPSCGYRWNQ